MSDKFRPVLTGTVIGVLAAGVLAIGSLMPAAVADEQPMKTLLSTADELWPPAFDTSKLVKFDFTVEPSVSTEVLRSSTVRKIGYGRTSLVTIAETASGIYSSDGLASPHIRYPGIHKERKRAAVDHIAFWSGRDGWVAFKAIEAGSFVSVTRFDGGKVVTSEDGNCVFVRQSAYC